MLHCGKGKPHSVALLQPRLTLVFRARLLDLEFGPGPESLEVALYDERDIPWNEIAFPVVHQTLQLYYEDRRQGHYGTHTGDIRRRAGEMRAYDTRMLRR